MNREQKELRIKIAFLKQFQRRAENKILSPKKKKKKEQKDNMRTNRRKMISPVPSGITIYQILDLVRIPERTEKMGGNPSGNIFWNWRVHSSTHSTSNNDTHWGMSWEPQRCQEQNWPRNFSASVPKMRIQGSTAIKVIFLHGNDFQLQILWLQYHIHVRIK